MVVRRIRSTVCHMSEDGDLLLLLAWEEDDDEEDDVGSNSTISGR